MKIKNLLPFVLTTHGEIGIAKEGPFASSAWLISDEAFNSMSGTKFAWIAPDGGLYTDHSSLFLRPTEQQVVENISPRLREKAIEMNLIEE